MKHLKIALLGIVSMLLMAFIIFIPMNAKAAKVTNGESVKLQKQGKQFYRFTLAEDALVQVNWSKNSKKKAAFIIYTDKDKTDNLYSINGMGSSGKDFIPLEKGTYYVDMYDNTASPTTVVKISWTYSSTYAKANYSAKTAVKLEADTLVHVVNTTDYNYDRWYKITLKKPQKVTLKAPYGNIAWCFIIDSKLRIVPDTFSPENKTEFSSIEVLPKGTYYIYIDICDVSFKNGLGEYIAFKWQ